MIFFPSPLLFHDDFLFLTPALERKKFCSKKRPACNDCEENADPPKKQSVVKGRFAYSIDEAEDRYDVSIDVPGIKLSDVELDIVGKNEVRIQAKRQSSKNTVTKYDQTLNFDNKSVDLTNIHASMENGVLTLKVGKKKHSKPAMVTVSSEPAPTDLSKDDSTKHDVLLTVDLPGVKIDDLKVKTEENYVHVDAKRHRGQSSVTIRKVITVDDTKHDVNQLKAHLADGVLTITAPRASQVETKKSSIPITLTSTAENNSTEMIVNNDTVDQVEDTKNQKDVEQEG